MSPVPLDTALDLLADRERRLVLEYLYRRPDRAVAYEELVRYVVARTPEGGHDASAHRLHHLVLPRLREAGLIEYDRHTETIQFHGDPRVEELLRCIDELDVTEETEC